MATFKVGQRVRILRGTYPGKEAAIWKMEPIYAWGPSVSYNLPGEIGHFLDVDGVGRHHRDGSPIALTASGIAPLTDPKADEFIESLEKLGREPNVIAPEKEKA
jgi:hypothetical protein